MEFTRKIPHRLVYNYSLKVQPNARRPDTMTDVFVTRGEDAFNAHRFTRIATSVPHAELEREIERVIAVVQEDPIYLERGPGAAGKP